MKKEMELVYIERERLDVFHYLVTLPDNAGRQHDMEVAVWFKDGVLHQVNLPFAIQEKDTDLRLYWEMQGRIAQVIENAERRLMEEGIAPPLHDIQPSDAGNDGSLPMRVVDAPTQQRHKSEKLSVEKVVAARRKWRSGRHKDLLLTSEGERLGVSGTALSNALIGVSWKAADEIEPPLSPAEMDRAMAYPKAPLRNYRHVGYTDKE